MSKITDISASKQYTRDTETCYEDLHMKLGHMAAFCSVLATCDPEQCEVNVFGYGLERMLEEAQAALSEYRDLVRDRK